MKRAIFPDVKTLQPMPTSNGAHANISGNVNNTTETLPNSQTILNTETEQNNITTSAPTTQKNNSVFYLVFWCTIILIIIFVIIFIYKKIGKKYGIKIEL